VKVLLYFFVVISFCFGFLLFLEQPPTIPVRDANSNDWSSESFWHGGWGVSGIHKGIDIFARRGAVVQSAAAGLVIFEGQRSLGGNVVIVLGPSLLVHDYAHLQGSNVTMFSFVHRGEQIGTVGTSGNAADKAPHLHYSVMSLWPQISSYASNVAQGWKQMFYLDPNNYLKTATEG
jgi:murein DD-endopeptidase MepM/ murein hydrolase activator NlpD